MRYYIRIRTELTYTKTIFFKLGVNNLVKKSEVHPQFWVQSVKEILHLKKRINGYVVVKYLSKVQNPNLLTF